MIDARLMFRALYIALSMTFAGCERLSALIPDEFRTGDSIDTSLDIRKRVVGGSPIEGRRIIEANVYGCVTCHTIPGIAGMRGVVGPPLDNFARRSFIAGTLPNEPGVLLAFMRDPPALVPATAMPNIGLSEEEARHVAAFLYSLRGRNHASR